MSSPVSRTSRQRGRIIVTLQGHSVGVFRVRDRFFAVHNRCPHKGAELCRGSVLGYLTADAPGELRYDAERLMLQCPWHGWEYDLETGESYVKNSRIRSYEIEVEAGVTVAGELDAGSAHQRVPDHAHPAELATGLSGPKLRQGAVHRGHVSGLDRGRLCRRDPSRTVPSGRRAGGG